MESSEALLVELATEAILVDLSENNSVSSEGGAVHSKPKGRRSFYSQPKSLSEEDDPFGLLANASKTNDKTHLPNTSAEPSLGTLVQLDPEPLLDKGGGEIKDRFDLSEISKSLQTFSLSLDAIEEPKKSKLTTNTAPNLSEMLADVDLEEPNWDTLRNEAHVFTQKFKGNKKNAILMKDEQIFGNYSPCAGEAGILDSPLGLLETSANFLVALTPEKSPTRNLRSHFGLDNDEEMLTSVHAFAENPAEISEIDLVKQNERRLSSIKENLEPLKQTQSRLAAKPAKKIASSGRPPMKVQSLGLKKKSVEKPKSGGPTPVSRSSEKTPLKPKGSLSSATKTPLKTPLSVSSGSNVRIQSTGTPRPRMRTPAVQTKNPSVEKANTPKLSKLTVAVKVLPDKQTPSLARGGASRGTGAARGRGSVTLPGRASTERGRGSVRPQNNSIASSNPRGAIAGVRPPPFQRKGSDLSTTSSDGNRSTSMPRPSFQRQGSNLARGSGLSRPACTRQGSTLSTSAIMNSTPAVGSSMVPPSPNLSLISSTPGRGRGGVGRGKLTLPSPISRTSK